MKPYFKLSTKFRLELINMINDQNDAKILTKIKTPITLLQRSKILTCVAVIVNMLCLRVLTISKLLSNKTLFNMKNGQNDANILKTLKTF